MKSTTIYCYVYAILVYLCSLHEKHCAVAEDSYYYYYDDAAEKVKEEAYSPEPDKYKIAKPQGTAKIKMDPPPSSDSEYLSSSLLKKPGTPAEGPPLVMHVEIEIPNIHSELSDHMPVRTERSNSVADMRAIFERNQAVKEKERKERELARLDQQALQNQRNAENKKRRENEMNELQKAIEKRKNGKHIVDDEYNSSLRQGKINADLEGEHLKRTQELEREMAEKATKNDDMRANTDTTLKNTGKETHYRERVKQEADSNIFGEVGIRNRDDDNSAPDYPPAGLNIKLRDQKNGFMKNPIPFVFKPVYPLLEAYGGTLVETLGCLTRGALEQIYKSDLGRKKLYQDTEKLDDEDEGRSPLKRSKTRYAEEEAPPSSGSDKRKVSVSELRAEFERSKGRKDWNKQDRLEAEREKDKPKQAEEAENDGMDGLPKLHK